MAEEEDSFFPNLFTPRKLLSCGLHDLRNCTLLESFDSFDMQTRHSSDGTLSLPLKRL
jgi:hypothetical protein